VLVTVAHRRGPDLMGELPGSVRVEVGPRPADGAEFWVPDPGGVVPEPDEWSAWPAVRVVQLLSAGVDGWVGRVPEHVTLCNAQGAHTSATAEWVLTAILAHLRSFPTFTLAQARGEWAPRRTAELAGQRALVIGAGSIGTAVADRLRPFDVAVTLVATTARPGVHGRDELPALLPAADIVVLVVPLTAATRRLVDAAFLAALPDGALLVNAARGPVVDTAALAAELDSGRLAAALDVTDPEPLPPGHPLWRMPNLLLTPHVAGSVTGALRRGYGLVGDQLRRYAGGEALINVIGGDY
jgi:phosphoglycerate dehydrogenase-like enzyme